MNQERLQEMLSSAYETVNELNDLVGRLRDAEGNEKQAFPKYLTPALSHLEEQVQALGQVAPKNSQVLWLQSAVFVCRQEIALNMLVGGQAWLKAKSNGGFGFFAKLDARNVLKECLANMNTAISILDHDEWRLKRAFVLSTIGDHRGAITDLQHITTNRDSQCFQRAREFLFALEKAIANGDRGIFG